MHRFPIKTLILCVLLPPFVYVTAIQWLETAIRDAYDASLEAVYIGDTRRLFDGSVRLNEAIRKNIDVFLASRKLPAWGVRVAVTVKTKDGEYIYPDGYDDPESELTVSDNMAVARENFRLLNEGLVKSVEVSIVHNTLMSNVILLACALSALLVFLASYRRGMHLIQQEATARQATIDGLEMSQQKSRAELEGLEDQRVRLAEKLDQMKTELNQERRKATANEEEMIDELVALEEKIQQNLALQDRQRGEIDQLKEAIKQYEKENAAKQRQQLKGGDAIRKRFHVLYKNVAMHDKAIDGFLELTEEMKIKAEELVHQLNDDPKMVQIKRKVFGKKNRETVFEVLFAYKGRLYFRTIPGNRVEVLAIGTKLTQHKDLVFLDNL